MNFEEKYKTLTDDKIISLLKQSNALKPEALVALKKEAANRSATINEKLDKIEGQKLKKQEDITKSNKTYFIESRIKIVVFFIYSLVVLFLISYFIYHLFFLQKIVFALIITIPLYIIFRKLNPILILKKDTLVINSPKKILFSKTFVEFYFIEKLLTIFFITTKISEIIEIKYDDIIELDSDNNQLTFYSNTSNLKEILDDFNTIFIEKNISNSENNRRIVKKLILLDYITEKEEILKILESKNIIVK